MTYNNFEITLVVFMPNITTNHAITYTNFYARAKMAGNVNKVIVRRLTIRTHFLFFLHNSYNSSNCFSIYRIRAM